MCALITTYLLVNFPTDKVMDILFDFYEDRRVKKAALEKGINGKDDSMALLKILFFSNILKDISRLVLKCLFQIDKRLY